MELERMMSIYRGIMDIKVNIRIILVLDIYSRVSTGTGLALAWFVVVPSFPVGNDVCKTGEIKMDLVKKIYIK